jgi:acyl-CoA synthetase (NDP forming)/GNAT superfamily N-acetyltransferase
MMVDTHGIDVDALLTDAGIVRIRTVQPSDAPALRLLHKGVSTDTLYLRFFSMSRAVVEEEIQALTRPPAEDHGALLAEIGGQVVGVATFERLDDDPEAAEVAFLVDDTQQGRGIGMLLLEHLAGEAVKHGVVRFVAETLPTNSSMLNVFRDAGFPLTKQSGHTIVHVEIPLQFDDFFRSATDRREAIADAASLRRLLAPASVAVVGAGSDPAGLGHQVLANIVRAGFTGTVYAVNQSKHRVAGVHAFRSLGELPERVDVVVVVVPADAVLDVAAEAAAIGATGLVVITAGFAEAGPVGAQLQRDLLRICRTAGMRLIGPNCMGIANASPGYRLNATFSPVLPAAGGVALMSQSGAIGLAALAHARRYGIGMSTFVSAGNKADVSGNDLLCAWENDPDTNVCALYLESFGNPQKFARIAARVGKTKPVIAVKSGRTIAGARSAASHTASAATPDIAVDSLFEQAGVARVDSLSDLFDLAALFDLAPLPKGRKVAIVGNSGGPGVLAADACQAAGLDVVTLSDTTRRRLGALVRVPGELSNPVDLLAEAEPVTFEAALRVLLNDPDIDAVIAVYTPIQSSSAAGIARALATVRADEPGKPLLLCMLGVDDIPIELREASGRPLVPYYTFPEPAARALGAAVRYAEWRSRPAGTRPSLAGIDVAAARAIVDRTFEASPDGAWLDATTAFDLVATHGIDVAPVTFVSDAGSAAAVAVTLGGQVALKAAGPDLVHKTEVGGVHLNLQSSLAVAEAYVSMADRLGAAMSGAVVQPMVPPGVEAAIGVVADPAFGPLVMVGLGGVASDLLADRAFHLLPISVEDAARQVRSLRGAPLLFGYRNTPMCNVDALEQMLLRVAELATNIPELAELDLNPVVVSPTGAVAVDVKIRLAPATARDPLLRRLAEVPRR